VPLLPGSVFSGKLPREGPPPAPPVAAGETKVLVLTQRSMESLRRFSPWLASRLQANLKALPLPAQNVGAQ